MVPSIWVENSPLVIHEALEAGVPIITADTGGMSEYIRHEENGLLFKHRDATDLAFQMQKWVDDPLSAKALSQKGYLFSKDHHIPSIENHVDEVESIYRRAVQENKAKECPIER